MVHLAKVQLEHSSQLAVEVAAVAVFVVVGVAAVFEKIMYFADTNYNYPLRLSSSPVAIEFELVGTNLENLMILCGLHLK